MPSVLLLQLPLPQLNYGRRTGNIPLGTACLQQAAAASPGSAVRLLPPVLANYLGDAALEALILEDPGDVLGFSVFSWNLERSLFLARRVKGRKRVRVVLGGPEVTPDNPLVRDPVVDFRAYGEGEAVFQRLLRKPDFWKAGEAALDAAATFTAASSPYRDGLLDPRLEDLLLLEGQRGCPYGCAYCYYGQTRRRPVARPIREVAAAARWALARGVGEIYLLDPSLDTRADLARMLSTLATLHDGRLRWSGEIRAEAVDDALADALAGAGFKAFEVGLQTTNPQAMQLMGRRTDAARFRAGVRRLEARGIAATIDLIVGLPGDDLAGFRRSLDFLVAHGLQNRVQVFPLSVLPGTAFRRRSAELGLRYHPLPPYAVEATEGFAAEDLAQAFAEAEQRLEVALRPPPDLDLAYRFPGDALAIPAPDLPAAPDGCPYVHKLRLARRHSPEEIAAVAGRLTHPYQVFVLPSLPGMDFLRQALALWTEANPHTPLELVWIEPPAPPDPAAVEAALRLARPHYLDRDALAGWGGPVVFTLAARRPFGGFGGRSRRRVQIWDHPRPPEPADLAPLLESVDGVLLETRLPAAGWQAWMARLAPQAEELPRMTFADPDLQSAWRRQTSREDYRADCGGSVGEV